VEREPALQSIQNKLDNLLVQRQESELDVFSAEANITAVQENYRELAGGRRAAGPLERVGDPGRGVRIHEVKFEGLYLSDDATQRLLERWMDEWREVNPPPVEEARERTTRETLIQFAEYAVQYFKQREGEQPSAQRLIDTLVALLKGTLRALPADSEAYRRLATAIRQLEDNPG
jgi:hypothetical protein